MSTRRSLIFLVSIAAIACTTSEPVDENMLQTLVGTSWTAVSVGGVAVAPGSTVTAQFSENGELTGNAGCNRYLASYQVEDLALRIDLTGASKRLCYEPSGIMQQETLFLSLLNSVSAFDLSNELLSLSSEDGATVMTLRQSD